MLNDMFNANVLEKQQQRERSSNHLGFWFIFGAIFRAARVSVSFFFSFDVVTRVETWYDAPLLHHHHHLSGPTLHAISKHYYVFRFCYILSCFVDFSYIPRYVNVFFPTACTVVGFLIQ